jgi:hypothetical protein
MSKTGGFKKNRPNLLKNKALWHESRVLRHACRNRAMKRRGPDGQPLRCGSGTNRLEGLAVHERSGGFVGSG